MMSGDEQAPTESPPAESDNGESGPPGWFVEHQAAMDKRFEGLAHKVRELGSKKQEPPAPPPEPPKSNGNAPAPQADPLALMRLGEARAKLPEAARQRLDELMSTGTSISQALALVDFATTFGAPANGADESGAAPAPPGNAASAAPRTTPNYPRSISEYMALAAKSRTDPAAKKRWDALRDDPGFDPETLRQD